MLKNALDAEPASKNCPRDVLVLVPRKSKVNVSCNSPLKGPDVKNLLSRMHWMHPLCEKLPRTGNRDEGALAVIDPAKCINCGICATKCPTKNITDRRSDEEKASSAAKETASV
jgi:4Fe-4S binding domain.